MKWYQVFLGIHVSDCLMKWKHTLEADASNVRVWHNQARHKFCLKGRHGLSRLKFRLQQYRGRLKINYVKDSRSTLILVASQIGVTAHLKIFHGLTGGKNLPVMGCTLEVADHVLQRLQMAGDGSFGNFARRETATARSGRVRLTKYSRLPRIFRYSLSYISSLSESILANIFHT